MALRWATRLAVGVLASILLYLAVNLGLVWWKSGQDQARPAQLGEDRLQELTRDALGARELLSGDVAAIRRGQFHRGA